eukprot:33905-Eustigmatos_ZCMA.PRE.1
MPIVVVVSNVSTDGKKDWHGFEYIGSIACLKRCASYCRVQSWCDHDANMKKADQGQHWSSAIGLRQPMAAC